MKKIQFILLMFIITSANAQTIDSLNTLSEVFVTSTRAKINDPISQINISTKELKKFYQGNDIPTVLNFSTPSVQFYSDAGNYNGYMYYRLRGADQTKINATLNGVPLNEPEDNGTYYNNFSDFFANVSSIQIQKGVATSTSGTPSYIGALNFQSPILTDSAYNKIEYGSGSFNTNRFSFAVNTGMKKNIGTYIRYSNISSDGYRDNAKNLGNTIFLSSGYQDSKQSLKYTMFYGTSKNQMAYLPSDEDVIKSNRRNNPLSKDETDYFIQNLNILSYTKSVNSKLTYSTSLYYNHLDGNYDYKYDSTIYNYKLKSYTYGLMNGFRYITNKFDISGGFNLSLYSRRHMMGIKPFDNTTYEHNNIGNKNQYDIYYKINYKITPKLSTLLDLQYRWVNFTYTTTDNYDYVAKWQFFNPKIGVNYQINNKSRVFGYVGISNKEPNRVDMFNYYLQYPNYYEADNLTTSDINSYGWNKVKPEKVYNFEIGYDISNKYNKLSVTGFYMLFKNGILPIGQLNNIGLSVNTNVDASYRSGLEVDYTLTINRFKIYLGGLLMTSNVLNGDSTIQGKQLLLTPNYSANCNLQYIYGRYSIMVVNKYVSQSYLSNTNNFGYLNAYCVTNLNLSTSFNKFSVGLNVNNIFNIDYYNSGQLSYNSDNTFRARQYFVAAPRNLFVSFNYQF